MSEIERFIKEASKIISEAGLKTALVISLGENESFIVPIYNSFVLNHAIESYNITGQDIINYFKRLLLQEGALVGISPDNSLIKDIKKKVCYIALNPDKEAALGQSIEKSYTRSDDVIIKVGKASFLAPECFFKPITIGKDIDPLGEAIVKIVGLCDMSMRKELIANIILSGTEVLPGLNERLTLEIKKKFSESIEVKIHNIM